MFQFSPTNMSGKMMSMGDAYGSDAPTLTYLDLCFGNGSSTMWLVLWVSSVFASCGFVQGQVTDQMKVDTANSIKQEYYYLKVSELVVFFKKFIAGKYNVFYGTPNPQVITKSLVSFINDRESVVESVEARRAKEKERCDRERESRNSVTFEDWAKSMKEKGEEVHLEAQKTKDGYVYRQKSDAKLVSAEVIVLNSSGCNEEVRTKLRDMFVEKYHEDPFDYWERVKKTSKYEEGRDS